ncbi:anti-sigma factor [Methylovorus glucosotrophus]|jgi:anti-sigma-K factor RskA|uniref:Anti-sigma K factor RskA C-terminal domain-containing protein n=1 Tax=Methylovorus glucosotrophus (strain SIP3-4) TaxID=582744 RepID=C6XDD0_METGS|nr:anti-sigma factor [Methylovorus glucosotrophus]ACT50555.1 conserved hypothetical protein [Methylovorus glucosotrophus SIP3-4]
MNYDNDNLKDMLSAEYVLGTLRGRARRRFLRLVETRPEWQAAIDWWRHRLNLLADMVPAIAPRKEVWQHIEIRLYGQRLRSALNWWRGLALAASGFVVVLAVFMVLQAQQPAGVTSPAPTNVAVLTDNNAKAGWMLSLTRSADGKAEMHAAALPSLQAFPDKSFELWILPADKSAPVSLGILPQQGKGSMPIPPTLLAALDTGGLAVTLEPQGGSPSGSPTGPVLYQGKLAQI